MCSDSHPLPPIDLEILRDPSSPSYNPMWDRAAMILAPKANFAIAARLTDKRDIDEAVSDTLEALHRRVMMGKYANFDHVCASCVKIARKRAITRFWYNKRRRIDQMVAWEDTSEAEQTADASTNVDSLLDVATLTRGLDPRRQEVVRARLAGEEDSEIARRLGVAESTVRSIFREARIQLTRIGARKMIQKVSTAALLVGMLKWKASLWAAIALAT